METIKITDLRVGNYIQDHECEPHIFQVEEIYKHIKNELWVSYRNGSIKSLEVDGVPITEEILITIGFRKQHSYFVKTNGSYYFYKNNLYSDIPASCNLIGDVQILYLHQLQNLYFALTGEELQHLK